MAPCRPKVKLVGWENSVEKQGEGYSLDLEDTLRSLKATIISCKENNHMLIEAHERVSRSQENQLEVNAMILQRLLDL